MSMHVTTGLPYELRRTVDGMDYHHFRQSSSLSLYDTERIARTKPRYRKLILKYTNADSLYEFLKRTSDTEERLRFHIYLFDSIQMFAEEKLKYARYLKLHVVPTISHCSLIF